MAVMKRRLLGREEREDGREGIRVVIVCSLETPTRLENNIALLCVAMKTKKA